MRLALGRCVPQPPRRPPVVPYSLPPLAYGVRPSNHCAPTRVGAWSRIAVPPFSSAPPRWSSPSVDAQPARSSRGRRWLWDLVAAPPPPPPRPPSAPAVLAVAWDPVAAPPPSSAPLRSCGPRGAGGVGSGSCATPRPTPSDPPALRSRRTGEGEKELFWARRSFFRRERKLYRDRPVKSLLGRSSRAVARPVVT